MAEAVKATPEKKTESKPKPKKAPEGEAAVPGSFAYVAAGEHKGLYGVVIDEPQDDGIVTLRTRDDDTQRVRVKLSDLRLAASGRR